MSGSSTFRHVLLSNVVPLCGDSFSGVWLPTVAHLPFHHLGKYFWCSRWDLNPHTRRAYVSETYVSTIPPPEHIQQTFTCCTCTPLMCRTVSRMLAFGSMALEYSLNARFEPHIYHSTTRANERVREV